MARLTGLTNFYAVLGISPSASAEEIRSAYLALMKRHHPDALGEADDEAKARELNRAYAVLRDPASRAEHDAALKLAASAPAGRAVAARRAAAGYRPFPAPAPASRRRSRLARTAAFLSLLAVAAAAFVAVQILRDFEHRAPAYLNPFAEAPKPARPEPEQPPIDAGLVIDGTSDAEFLVLNGAAADVETFSRSCFLDLEEMPTLKLLDRCLAFDLAASRWLAIARRNRESDFFSRAALSERQRQAFRLLGFGRKAAEERAQRLDELTVREIALRLERPLTGAPQAGGTGP